MKIEKRTLNNITENESILTPEQYEKLYKKYVITDEKRKQINSHKKTYNKTSSGKIEETIILI